MATQATAAQSVWNLVDAALTVQGWTRAYVITASTDVIYQSPNYGGSSGPAYYTFMRSSILSGVQYFATVCMDVGTDVIANPTHTMNPGLSNAASIFTLTGANQNPVNYRARINPWSAMILTGPYGGAAGAGYMNGGLALYFGWPKNLLGTAMAG